MPDLLRGMLEDKEMDVAMGAVDVGDVEGDELELAVVPITVEQVEAKVKCVAERRAERPKGSGAAAFDSAASGSGAAASSGSGARGAAAGSGGAVVRRSRRFIRDLCIALDSDDDERPAPLMDSQVE